MNKASSSLRMIASNSGKITWATSLVLTLYGGWQLQTYLSHYQIGFPIELNLFPVVLILTGLCSLAIILSFTAAILLPHIYICIIFGEELKEIIPQTPKISERVKIRELRQFVSEIYLLPALYTTLILFTLNALDWFHYLSYAAPAYCLAFIAYSAYMGKTHSKRTQNLSALHVCGIFMLCNFVSMLSIALTLFILVLVYNTDSDIIIALSLIVIIAFNALCFLPIRTPIKSIIQGREIEKIMETKPTPVWSVGIAILLFIVSLTQTPSTFLAERSLKMIGIGGGIEKTIYEVRSKYEILPITLFSHKQETGINRESKELNLILNSGTYSYFQLKNQIYKIKNDYFIEVTDSSQN